MSTPRVQTGHIFERHGAFHIRFYVHEDRKRTQRSHKLCAKDADHPTKDAHSVLTLAEDFIMKINLANQLNDATRGHNCPICGNACKRSIAQTFVRQV